MKAFRAILVAALLGAVVVAQESDKFRGLINGGIRFQTLDVFVESGRMPLAAYQLSFSASRTDVKIIGIEGGESAPFRAPPYFDRRAIQTNHVILAALSTAPAPRLPFGLTRVATLHLQIVGRAEPRYSIQLETAASPNGEYFRATAYLQARN